MDENHMVNWPSSADHIRDSTNNNNNADLI